MNTEKCRYYFPYSSKFKRIKQSSQTLCYKFINLTQSYDRVMIILEIYRCNAKDAEEDQWE